jgi:hypothetical protein
MLNFKVHKDKEGLARFSRELSSSMKAIKELQGRGVQVRFVIYFKPSKKCFQVELGIPIELWDSPSVETSLLKQHCDWLNEEFEDVILDWFHSERSKSLRV